MVACTRVGAAALAVAVAAAGSVSIAPNGAVSMDPLAAIQSLVEEPLLPGGRRNSPILPPGHMIMFKGGISPRSFAFAPLRNALLMTDWTVPYVPAPFPWNWLGYTQPGTPRAFLFMPNGQLMRRMDFPGKEATPYGVAEDVDGCVAFTFYTLGKDAIEVWDPTLDTKLTFHEQSVRPSMPWFDPSGNGVMWLSYTIADRQYEEGEGVLALWAYNRDGTRWEVFPRREFTGTKYIHSSAMDAARRVWTAGLSSWIWDLYGFYGPMWKDKLDVTQPHVFLEVTDIVFDRKHPAWIREGRARYNETHPRSHIPEGTVPASVDFRAALHTLATFPFPFNCLWPLFDITPDGYALTTCYESDAVVILRVFTVAPDGSGSTLLPAPEPVATLRRPYGFTSIVGVRTCPSGKAVVLLDRVSARMASMPWPIPGLTSFVSSARPYEGIPYAATATGLWGPLFTGDFHVIRSINSTLV